MSMKPDGTYHEMSGTSMACPHICGLITCLMTKGGAYYKLIRDDLSCRELLNDRFCIDIGTEGRDNQTGLGFLTYLSRDEFEEFFDLPDFGRRAVVPKPTISTTITVGLSDSNSKEVKLPYENMIVSPIPVNSQHHTWRDKFEVSVSGNILKVTRTDKRSGWGQNLRLVAKTNP
jgi:hypothetical protein